MKKIGLLVLTVILTITLFACTKGKLYANAFVTGLGGVNRDAISTTQIEPEIKIVDPDEQLETQDIVMGVYDKNSKLVGKERRVKKNDELLEGKEFIFNELTEDTSYKFIITTTYNGRTETLNSIDFNTNKLVKIDITTPEQFLEIKKNLNAEYTLKNDIDFSEVPEADIKDGVVGRFRGKFDGGGFTIRNYSLTSRTSSVGLFSQLSEYASIKNLNLDNIQLTKEFPPKTSEKDEDDKTIEIEKPNGTSSYIGVLFGQNASTNVEVDNITIKNSKLDLGINSTSSFLKFGILGGTAAGKFSNITIDNSNELDLSLKKHSKVYVGGVVGELNNAAEFSEVVNGGNVTVNINQNTEDGKASTSGLDAQSAEVYIGGFAGTNGGAEVNNVISSTNIKTNDLSYHIEGNGDIDDDKPDKGNKYLVIKIGGLFGEFSNYNIDNMIFKGNIEITEKMTFTNNLTEILKDDEGNELEPTAVHLNNKYYMQLFVGGIAGSTSRHDESINSLVRDGGSITIVEQDYVVGGSTQAGEGLKDFYVGTIFGSPSSKSSGFTYGDHNKFGQHGSVNDTYNGVVFEPSNIRQILDLNEFFKDNEWLLNKLK